ncbi:MAG: phosphotransferase [Tetrasphaera sp.]|nr:phosphotransferase [Tetrasphaera sp.]
MGRHPCRADPGTAGRGPGRPPAGGSPRGGSGWAPAAADQWPGRGPRLGARPSGGCRGRCRGRGRQCGAAPPERVLLHADLIPGNLVVRDGRIVGLLDLGTLTTGYPAWDLTCAWWVLDARGRERLRAGLELDPDDPSWLWGRAFGLLQGTGARWYYEAKGHPLAALGARTVEHAIAAPEPDDVSGGCGRLQR